MHPNPIRPAAFAALLALALAAPVPAAAAEPPPAPPREDTPAVPDASTAQAADPMEVPPGTKADQALWRKAIEVSNLISIARAEAARLQWRARNGNYDTRLAERAAGKTDAEAARLKALAAKVQAAWQENSELLASRWPVDPTRGCQYPAQQLESTMHMPDGAEKSAAMVGPRAEVTRCTDAADLILRRVGRSNQDLEKAIVEADAAFAPAPPPAAK